MKGRYVSGCGHGKLRPEFYRRLGTQQGTINIQLPLSTGDDVLIPTDPMPGFDPIDVDQKFRIRACKLKGVAGYQILPVDKTTGAPRGHYSDKQIEISLKEKIDLERNEDLEVELQGFGD